MDNLTDTLKDIPPTLLSAAVGLIIGIPGFFLGRRLNKATTFEKEANALLIMTEVSDNLAKQLKAFESEVPSWKKRVADEAKKATLASERCKSAKAIKAQALIIAEEMSHLSYLSSPGEPETSVERRFKAIREAVNVINGLTIIEEAEESL